VTAQRRIRHLEHVAPIDEREGFQVDLVVDHECHRPLERWRVSPTDEEGRLFLDEWAGPVAQVDTAGVMLRLLDFVGATEGTWFSFEWIPRVELRRALRSEGARGGLALPLVCRVLREVARGLAAIHRPPLAIVHRGLSADRVAFGVDGAVVVDWRPNHSRDVRAAPPFERESDFDTLRAVHENDRPRVLEARPDAPEPLAALVERMLAQAPGARPTPSEIVEVVDRDLTWAAWDADACAGELRSLVPRDVEAVLALDDRARTALARGAA
jgi:hypothetical protein